MFQGVGFFAHRILLVSALIAASASLAIGGSQASQPPDNAAAAKAQVAQNFGKIPLSFEANQGQAVKTVKFISKGSGYSLFLTDSSAVLALSKPDASNAKPGLTVGKGLKPVLPRQAGKTDVLRMDLAGANRAMQVTGVDQLPGTANYFIGNDPAKWRSGVSTFARVKYAGVYPGVDLVYYGSQRQLEYDFVVAPGASPKPIRLQFAGAKKVDLTADGDLTVSATNGQIAFHKPVVYQVKDGLRQPIDGQFAVLSKNTIGFTLGRYDHSKSLVIDPVLTYSTYLGGTLADGANGIAVDSSGNAYVVGSTFSTNFPVTTGAAQSVNNEPANFQCVFISKLNPTGTALVYSTYLGGSGATNDASTQFGDVGQTIAVDSAGDAYVTGLTQSTSFPTTPNAFQLVNNSTLKGGLFSAFVTKLNPTGTALVYSTYLGGNFEDSGSGIAVDTLGHAYVTGYTTSSTFPVTPGAYQLTNNANITSGWGSAFVTEFNLTGTALVYSTFLGGTGYGAKGTGIAVDSLGDAYVTGSSNTTDFPITNGAFQTTNYAAAAVDGNPDAFASNVFVTKLNPTGTQLVYSTYVGGSTDDYGTAIALDDAGDAYVTGSTYSKDFPVAGNAYQPTNLAYANEASAGFVTEVNPTGTALVYSTFLSGSGIPPQFCGTDCTSGGSGDAGTAIAVDALGDAYVTGSAVSTNFPTTAGAYQTVNNAAGNTTPIGVNAFITKLNPGGSQLLYSTYLGGNVQDFGYGIALDGLGGVYVTGQASSQNFPTTAGSYQPAYAGGFEDAYISKFAIGSVATTIATTTSLTPSANPQVQGSSVTFTATVTPASGTAVPTGNVVFSVDGTAASTVALDNTGSATYTTASLTAGPHTILASYAGSIAYTASSNSLTETISEPQAATPIFSPAVGTYTSTQSVTLTDSTTGAAIYYTTDGTPPTASSTVYTGAISVSATETVEAIAIAPGFANSVVSTATYTINLAAAATPVISPAAGTFSSTQSVTITDATTGATIYYTTNGTPPTASSTPYTGAISVSATETIEAIAVATGFTNSAVASATYTINLAAAATPVISPTASTFTSAQSVTITDSTAGATIYYTTNGTPPTASSTVYTGAISVSASETIEAIAIASGFSNSAVATANYVIVVTAPGYTLSANPSFLTFKSGSTGTTVITVTPVGGFTGTVNFSCGTLPSEVTCTFSPASLTVAAGGSALTTTLTVGTTGTVAASLRDGPAGTLLPGIFVAMILLPLGFTRRILRIRKTGSPWLIGLLLLATTSLAAAGMFGLAGCGGKSKKSAPAGTYSIPIEVTSGGTTVPLSLSIIIQ
jgi:hypothetical protein